MDLLKILPRTPEGHWNTKSLPIIKDIKAVIDPKLMMEIGLNNGYSAILWMSTLNLTKFYSIDIGIHSFTDKVSNLLKTQFDPIYDFKKMDSRELQNIIFA